MAGVRAAKFRSTDGVFVLRRVLMTNQHCETTATSAATALATFSVEDLAADTANPELFMEKYRFYVNQLCFTPDEAVQWAKRTVRVDTHVKVASK